MTTPLSLTASMHVDQKAPICPAPLFDDYFPGTDTSGQDAAETMESAPERQPQPEQRTEKECEQQKNQQQSQSQQQAERPKRKRCVPKLSENKLTPNAEQSSTNLIVRKLPSRADEMAIKRIFAPYGEILSAAVMRNIHTGENLGTAFVRFATTEQARTALVECHGRRVFGRTISVHWAKKQHDDTPVGEARKKIFKLFVRNIPLDITVDDLTTLFQQYGPVKDVTLHKDTAAVADRRLERRIAFVAYLVEGAAERAAECVHNTQPFHSCCRIPLMVKLAEDHQQKRGSASNTHNANNNTNTTTDVPSPTATAEMKSADQHSSTSSNNVTNSSRSSSSYNTNTEDSRRNFFPGTAACVQESRSNLLLPASLIASVLSRAHYSAGSSSSSSDRNMYRNGEAHAGRRRYMHNPYSAFHSRVYIVAS
ncbi:RNA recognition motif domain [Trypanosoma melophagium]|uniref:RNA recognition motif domain n=1 Tax=Trypanosoma melophagium TaxID=715481 RepID=UPI00351A0C7F|nr:RNA recognition motif domain [Trypanosoma melophagium]